MNNRTALEKRGLVGAKAAPDVNGEAKAELAPAREAPAGRKQSTAAE